MPNPTTITIDGHQLPLSTFSPEVQSMVLLATRWGRDQKRAESRLEQIRAALFTLNGSLNQKVAEELKARTVTIETGE